MPQMEIVAEGVQMRHVLQSIDFLQEELDLQLPAIADEIVEEVDDE